MAEYIAGTDGQEVHWLTGERIVRCRDCKHSPDGGNHCEWFDSYEPIPGGDEYRLVSEEVNPCDFCAWGKPKESEL